ncbi:MAG: hypothetical protein Q9O62_08770 [Ardenticatenia bacterium]|nr:hypothetical protein [Ardenticatenia bacterium]
MPPRFTRLRRKRIDSSKLKKKHVRLICPHCGKTVKIGKISRFQRAMPCPSCRVPIGADYIQAAMESTQSVDKPVESGAIEKGDGEG